MQVVVALIFILGCALAAQEDCSANEKWMECSGCEGTCDQPKVICTKNCRPAKCECPMSSNFVRHVDGSCIAVAACPKDD